MYEEVLDMIRILSEQELKDMQERIKKILANKAEQARLARLLWPDKYK